jgi:hypothetical protein
MSDAAGAQAISAVSNGDVVERLGTRVFGVKGRGGKVYTVVLYFRPLGAALTSAGQHVCTCEAGQHGRRCWHTRAAELMARRNGAQG